MNFQVGGDGVGGGGGGQSEQLLFDWMQSSKDIYSLLKVCMLLEFGTFNYSPHRIIAYFVHHICKYFSIWVIYA